VVPDKIGDFETVGAKAVLTAYVDDYAEVWINRQKPRRAGYPSPAAIQGFNMPNRVVLADSVEAGDQFQIAVFGINGPISVAREHGFLPSGVGRVLQVPGVAFEAAVVREGRRATAAPFAVPKGSNDNPGFKRPRGADHAHLGRHVIGLGARQCEIHFRVRFEQMENQRSALKSSFLAIASNGGASATSRC
jgi:hypothetical protein